MKPVLLALLFAASAHADVIATVETNAGKIEVHNTDGACVDGAKHALFVGGGKKIPGCWVHIPGGMFMVFFDGDTARVPISALKVPEAS